MAIRYDWAAAIAVFPYLGQTFWQTLNILHLTGVFSKIMNQLVSDPSYSQLAGFTFWVNPLVIAMLW